jgi:hypothetical protein
VNEGVARLMHHQSGVATYGQLVGAGMTRDQVRAYVDGGRWQRVGRHCLVSHNFTPSRAQVMWIAVLDPPDLVALAGFTSLQLRGFTFFGREPELLHVVVRRGATYHRLPGLKIHESRRLTEADIGYHSGLPCTSVARSALDAAAWQPFPRYACGVLAAVVQQRLCSAQDLSDELPFVGRIRHKAHLRLAIGDIAGGAEALSEIDIAALCRRFELREPDRQVLRRDRQGRKRYLDCEWFLGDGHVVVLEVDGSHHAEVRHWEADMKRERSVVISGRRVLRATANEARHDQRALAADLRAVGVPSHGVVSAFGGRSPQTT